MLRLYVSFYSSFARTCVFHSCWEGASGACNNVIICMLCIIRHECMSGALQTEEMRLELDGLKSLAKLKTKELYTLKKLAAIVLQQRTEVEQFFLDALTEVKLEVARRRKAAAAAATFGNKTPLERSGIGLHYHTSPLRAAVGSKIAPRTTTTGVTLSIPSKLPLNAASTFTAMPDLVHRSAHSSGSHPSSSPSPLRSVAAGLLSGRGVVSAEGSVLAPDAVEEIPSSVLRRIDISELLPEDKERVLRLLFAKINSFAATRRVATPGLPPATAAAEDEYQHGMEAGEDEGGGSTQLNAPFGLAADIPPALSTIEYGGRGALPPKPHIPRPSRLSAAPPSHSPRAGQAPSSTTAGGSRVLNASGESPSASASAGKWKESPFANLIAEAMRDDVAAEHLPETAQLADSLVRKVHEREHLSRQLGVPGHS